MKLDTVTPNAAGAWGGVLAITTLTCRAQANGANSLALSVRMLSCGLLAVLILLTGCARETLFKSNFDQTPIGQPPSHAQAVGTANVDGPAGSVVVVAPPVTASGKWSRSASPANRSLWHRYRVFLPRSGAMALILFQRSSSFLPGAVRRQSVLRARRWSVPICLRYFCISIRSEERRVGKECRSRWWRN